MRQSRLGYYADFVVYPFLALALAAAALRGAAPFAWLEWIAAFLVGLSFWTFFEYILHRFIFHDFPFFGDLHNAHHADPTAFVGTPTALGVSFILSAILLPLWWGINFDFASALTAGFVVGYVWYAGIHHALHHFDIKPDSLLFRAKRRHALHHYARQSCNFGVTNGVWDRVFGTSFETR